MTGRAMIAGVDEAGRGPLAGPVVAAAVVLGTMPIDGLGDSKTKSEAQRKRLFEQIEVAAADVGVGIATVAEIDRLNILAATHAGDVPSSAELASAARADTGRR